MTEELWVREKDFKDLNEDLKSLIVPLLQFTRSTDYKTFVEFLILEGYVDIAFDPQDLWKMGFKHVDVRSNWCQVSHPFNHPFLPPIQRVIESRTITLKW